MSETRTQDKSNLDDNNVVGLTFILRTIGNLPNCWRGTNRKTSVKSKLISRANKYLENQAMRIYKAAETGDLEKAIIIWCLLAKQSKTYQIYLYNKVRPQWYWKISERQAEKEMIEVINHMRRWNLRSYIDRYYILKKDGKYRPIGAPRLASKVMSRFLSDMVTSLLEPARIKDSFSNHAYRPNRGTYTAIMEFVREWKRCLKENKTLPYIYEFDLKAFFNNVTWGSIGQALDRKLSPLASTLVLTYLHHVRYHWREEYKEEDEMTPVGNYEIVPKTSSIITTESGFQLYGNFKESRPIYVRKGVPQGLPLSPVLATLTCEIPGAPKGTIMYADDGIYIGYRPNKFQDWMKSGMYSGRILQESKSRWIEDPKNAYIKFLGKEIHLGSGTIYDEKEGWFNIYNDERLLENWLKRGNYYKKNPKKRWEWQMHSESYAIRHKVSLFSINILYWIPILFFGFFKLEYRGYKWIPFYGIYSYTNTSTHCLHDLLWVVKRLKNSSSIRSTVGLKIPEWRSKEYPKPLNKQGYKEWNPSHKNSGLGFVEAEQNVEYIQWWMQLYHDELYGT